MEERERLGTPSTNTSNSVSVSESQQSNVVEAPIGIPSEYEKSSEDLNQWIRYPTLLTEILNNQEIEDPIAHLK